MEREEINKTLFLRGRLAERETKTERQGIAGVAEGNTGLPGRTHIPGSRRTRERKSWARANTPCSLASGWSARGPRYREDLGGRRGDRAGRGGPRAPCAGAAEGARTVPLRPRGGTLRPAGQPQEAAMVSPDAGAARGGRPRTAGPSPRTPRSVVSSPEAGDLQERGGRAVLTDREAARLRAPPALAPPPWPAAAPRRASDVRAQPLSTPL